MNDTPLEKSLDNFVNTTAKSKVAVIIPLYGYWRDQKVEQLNNDTLKATLDRVYSGVHHLYVFFIAETKRVPPKIGNIILASTKAGNAQGVAVSDNASYPEYVAEGLSAAMEETDAQFFIVVNPWVMLRHNTIDALVNRINAGDNAKVVSGFDLRGVIQPEGFDNFMTTMPKEQRDLTFDLVGFTRATAEMMRFDPNYKTHKFMERDIWQNMYQIGNDVITTQRVPFYSFDLDWAEIEDPADVEADRQYFISKWKFDPSIT